MIELAVAAANTAPSGADQQPWEFVAVGAPALRHSGQAPLTSALEFYRE